MNTYIGIREDDDPHDVCDIGTALATCGQVKKISLLKILFYWIKGKKTGILFLSILPTLLLRSFRIFLMWKGSCQAFEIPLMIGIVDAKGGFTNLPLLPIPPLAVEYRI